MQAKGTDERPVVVVTGDHLGNRVSSLLEADGCEIVRGLRPVERRLEPVLLRQDWARVLPRAQVIVISPRDSCTKEMLLAARRLRGIVSTVIGVDTIDMATADELGLIVGHGAMPENYIGVAEATVMFFAALSLELRKKELLLRSNLPLPDHMLGRMVHGRTVGLIGLGRVGRAVAERMAGWGVTVLAVDPLVQPGPETQVLMVDLPTLLKRSDFVSVHTTLTPQSRHLLGTTELAMMKPSAYLVNTARGAVIDEGALIESLRAGRLAGAALDVFEDEPLSPDSPLRELDNVILTPHMIGHSDELLEAIGSVGAENVRRILRGEVPLYLKNPDVLAAWRVRLASLEGSIT